MKIEGDNYSRRAEIYWNSKYLRRLIDEGHKKVFDYEKYMNYTTSTGTFDFITYTTGTNTWINVV